MGTGIGVLGVFVGLTTLLQLKEEWLVDMIVEQTSGFVATGNPMIVFLEER